MADVQDPPVVRCRECGQFYEARTNLLNGKLTWFPTCKHGPEKAEVVQ